MKKIIPVLLTALCCSLFFTVVVHAQRASVSVDNFSGAAGANIPIMNLQYGNISVPIGLSYNGGGVKVKEAEGSAGMGWNLYAGGQVSRQVRGLPDDVHLDLMGEQRLGWMRNSNGSKINSFSIANDNNHGTTTDDYADYNYIQDNFLDLSDTEPDIFYVSAPGLNCKLVFDGSHNIKTIPYQDLKVSYTVHTAGSTGWDTYGRITSFTITTPAGLTYTFDKQEMTRKTTASSSAGTLQFFKRDYELYQNGITYASAWKLGSIADLSGHVLSFYYEALGDSRGTDVVAMRRDTGTDLTSFTTSTWTDQTRLRLITDDDVISYTPRNNSVVFSYTTAETSGVSILTGISGMGTGASLNYITAKTDDIAQKKTFLNYVSTGLGYTKFEYYGLSGDVIALPDSLSKEIDQWGFYNKSSATSLYPNVYINPSTSGYERLRSMPVGSASSIYAYSLGGTDRYVSSTYIANGSLKSVEYPEGGKTTITYEPNDYHDATSASTQVGGGIRVKELTDYDGISTGNNVVTNYTYINPATSASSGKAIAVPLLAFNAPYVSTGTTEVQWKNSVIRLKENISQENTGVAYSHVKVARSGMGSSLFEYALPATNWDASAAPDWAPTVVNVALTSSYLSNEANAYPFVPNTNFDFERGLLNKLTQFNESGDKVTESTYTYERSNSPLVINALKFDANDGAMAYAKYTIYANVGKLRTVETNTVFDAPSTTQYNQSSTNYYYGSATHKMPTLVQQTKSDGSIARNYTKYLTDYNVGSHSDDQTTAMYNLQQLGVNVPIESYGQLERSSVNKTISAALVKLKPWAMDYSLTYNLPVQQLSLLRADGITDFAPSSISSGTFVNDSRYVVKQNILSYQQNGVPLTVDDNKRQVQTVLTNNTNDRAVAAFGNANATEVGYNDFDYYNPASAFTKNVYLTATKDNRSGVYADSLVVGNTFTRSITMAVPRKSYVFSLWIKSGGSGTVTLALTNASSATSNYYLGFTSTSGQWKYYQLKVPVTNMSTAFTAQFQSNANIFIDDVLFYPADATVSTSAYADISHHLMASTAMNGQAQYFEHDQLGRVTKVLDQDRNVLLKKSYVSIFDQQVYSANIAHYNEYEDIPTHFYESSLNRNDDFATYTWNFGDGTSAVSNSNANGAADHVYASPGTYTVTLTKTSALLGAVTVTQSVVIAAYSAPSIITGAGDLVVNLYQGSTLMYTISGTALTSGTTTITPGTYAVEVLTGQDPYSTSYPGGFKKWAIDIYNNSTLVGQNCFSSSPNVKILNTSMSFSSALKYHFSISTSECILEEM